MQLISHRGNIFGPIPEKENHPNYIDCAINDGYGESVRTTPQARFNANC